MFRVPLIAFAEVLLGLTSLIAVLLLVFAPDPSSELVEPWHIYIYTDVHDILVCSKGEKEINILITMYSYIQLHSTYTHIVCKYVCI